MNNASRLEELADIIATQPDALGPDFSTGCWGAVAKRIANDHGMDPCDYFGFSPDLYHAAIRTNRVLPEDQRNYVMSTFTQALATTVATTETGELVEGRAAQA